MKREKNRNRIKETGRYLLFYTLLFAVVSLCVFIWFFIDRRSFCWTTDAVSQYVPKAAYFIRHTMSTLTSLLSGSPVFQMYDFSIGMGDAVTLHLEPVYWLLLLFGAEHVEMGYGFVLIFRMYLAGLSMSAFLLYFKNGKWESLLASMTYVFCGFGLYGGLRHSTFFVPMILFPLLLLGMEEIYRNKRWYWCTIFTAVSFWCGYYFTYMNTIGMGLYFLFRFFGGEKKKSWGEFWKNVGVIAGSYLLGIAISNITLFNTFAGYLGSSRTVSRVAENRSLIWYGTKWIGSFFRSFISTGSGPGRGMYMGFIPLAYIAVVVLFIRKGRKPVKAGFLMCILFGLVPVFGLIFSGFGTLTNRWCYMLAFLMAVILAALLREMTTLSKKELGLVFLGILPYLFLMVIDRLRKAGGAKYSTLAGALLLFTFLCLCFLNLRKQMTVRSKGAVLTALVIFSLGISGMTRYSQAYAGMADEFTKAGSVVNKITNTSLAAADAIEDDGFYRCSTLRNSSSVQNASLILGYNGITQYDSVVNKYLVDYYRELGITSWSLVRVRGLDDRGFLDSLAAVKYYIMEKGEVYDLPYGYEKVKETERKGKTYEIFQNKYALPMGITYDTVMTEEEMESYPSVQRGEVMMQAAVMEAGKVEEKGRLQSEELQITGQKVNITDVVCENVELGENYLKVKEKDGKITFFFDGIPNSETYLNIEGMRTSRSGNMRFYIDSGDTSFDYLYHSEKSNYATSQEDYIFNLRYSEEGKTSCTIRFNAKATINFDELSIYCQSMDSMETYVNERTEEVLEDVQVLTNTVKGRITVDEEKMLVLSIPYQAGWTAWVDGEPAEISKVNLMYMGLRLQPGEHTVELRFGIPGIGISLIISAAGMVIFLTALVIRRKRKHAAQHYHSLL